jgi:hypothetical protein
VAGLKGDLRAHLPMQELTLLSAKKKRLARSAEVGMQGARDVEADGYGECSAKTGENVLALWHGIVEFVLADVKKRERKECPGFLCCLS